MPVVAAVMFGASYNVVVAVQVIWSGRIYSARPSAGLAATVAMNAFGLLLGPPLLGAVADQTGLARSSPRRACCCWPRRPSLHASP